MATSHLSRLLHPSPDCILLAYTSRIGPKSKLLYAGSRRQLERRAHSHAHTASATAKETPLLGDDPPLYDGKPRWWARWAWGLLALDMLFTASTIDITMNHWSQLVGAPKSAEPSPSSSSSSTQEKPEPEQTYQLRPLYQRLLLSTAQLVGGALVGGFILASRERTVWKMQLKRLQPILSSSKSSKSKLPSHSHSHSHQHTHLAQIPSKHQPIALTLSTASGRSKRFHLRECLLSPGRDATELILRVHGLRGHWWIGLNGAKVLGQDEAEIVASLPNSVPNSKMKVESGKEKVEDEEESKRLRGLAALAAMRERMMKAWADAGGLVDTASGKQADAGGKSGAVGGWTSGPVTR